MSVEVCCSLSEVWHMGRLGGWSLMVTIPRLGPNPERQKEKKRLTQNGYSPRSWRTFDRPRPMTGEARLEAGCAWTHLFQQALKRGYYRSWQPGDSCKSNHSAVHLLKKHEVCHCDPGQQGRTQQRASIKKESRMRNQHQSWSHLLTILVILRVVLN